MRDLAALDRAYAAALDAPLSAKKAMLCVLIADGFADRLFAMQHDANDILAFREALAARSAALALVFAVATMREGGPRLAVEASAVPLEDYPHLPVEDFMVSVYNDRTVQRGLIVDPEGKRHDAHAMLGEAVAVLRAAAAD